jgi:4a-hydroxytetrahydrobiopterin dehydratase
MATDLLDEGALAAGLAALPGWAREGARLVKVYDCKSFPAAAALLLRALLLAERMDHHPDIDLRYSKLRFALTSHDAGGLTRRDLLLARALDEAAREGGAR